MRSTRLGEPCIDAFIAGDVHVAEYTADFGCKCLALVSLQIKDGDLHTLCGQRAGGCLTKARCAAGDDCCDC